MFTSTKETYERSHPLDGSIRNGGLTAETERAFITAINGKQLTLDRNLKYNHLVKSVPNSPTDWLRAEVANLSRNVVVESDNPNGPRGHTMYHTAGKGSISFAEFRYLGKEGVLGRYPIHFHKLNDGMRGSSVVGASVWDSGNRWITVHGTQYMTIRNTVGYWSVGHGFFLEDGSEVYTLFDNVLGVNALRAARLPGQALPWDQNEGGCYWAANARNFVMDSTFVECDDFDSFIIEYEVPNPDGNKEDTGVLSNQTSGKFDEKGYVKMEIETLMPNGQREVVEIQKLSGGLYKNIEVHSTDGWGPWIRGGNFPEEEPLAFEDIKVWNTHYSIDISANNVTFKDVEMHNSEYGIYNLYNGNYHVDGIFADTMSNSAGGVVLAYFGPRGVGYVEDVTMQNTLAAFRMEAREETGNSGKPFVMYVRDANFLDPNGSKWGDVENNGNNGRATPLLALVFQDFFGSGDHGFAMPRRQNESQQGVPNGANFVPARDVVGGHQNVKFYANTFKVANVSNVNPWPAHPILNPVDTIPPASVILSPKNHANIGGNTVIVRGVSLDTNGLQSVRVNGVAAQVDANGRDWSVSLPIQGSMMDISVVATDPTGNTEQHIHTVMVHTDGGSGGRVLQPPRNFRIP